MFFFPRILQANPSLRIQWVHPLAETTTTSTTSTSTTTTSTITTTSTTTTSTSTVTTTTTKARQRLKPKWCLVVMINIYILFYYFFCNMIYSIHVVLYMWLFYIWYIVYLLWFLHFLPPLGDMIHFDKYCSKGFKRPSTNLNNTCLDVHSQEPCLVDWHTLIIKIKQI